MKRFWYTMAVVILLVFAGLLWVQRGVFFDAMKRLSHQPDTSLPYVAWTSEPDVPLGSGAPGSSRLRHVVFQLLKPGAIAFEAVLSFDSDSAFDAFLKDSGRLKVLASIPSLRAVRVGYDAVDDLNDIPDDAETSANFLVQLPLPPDPQGPGIQESAVPFGSNALAWLGVTDNSAWGEGKRIAVIDTGVVDHPTFGETRMGDMQDFVSTDDAVAEVNGHGTAVASVAAGRHPAAPGVSPAAEVLSFRVADADGNSDSFTLAEGILAAVEAKADVINISLGSVGNSNVVEKAIQAAVQAGSTIVAAAGNDGTATLTYPAAYEGVISVGSIDAMGQHLNFSNSSDQLSLSAPGYAVPAAWPDEQVIQFTGTSASAPFVTGAIAAIMSWDANITGQEAYDVLMAHANEAGAPGYDAIYGNGVLNMGRVVNATTPGIYDAAIASHHYAGDLEGNGREILQVVIENRGTEHIPASTLIVDSPVGRQQFTLSSMKPGSVISRELAVDKRRAEVEGIVHYTTTLTLPENMSDYNLDDNELSSSFSLPGVEEVTEP